MFSIVSNIAVWPDGSWCIEDEIQIYMASGLSDDFKIVTFFNPLPESAVDSFIWQNIL